jgi:hypothetical protein
MKTAQYTKSLTVSLRPEVFDRIEGKYSSINARDTHQKEELNI